MSKRVDFAKERRAVTDWLSPLNFMATQNEVLGRRQEGTGQWLLDSEKFKNWVNGTEKVLWCPGIREYQDLRQLRVGK